MAPISFVIGRGYLTLISSVGWAIKPQVLFPYAQSLSYAVSSLAVMSFEDIQDTMVYNDFFTAASSDEE